VASLVDQAKSVESRIGVVIASFDLDDMPVKERDLLTACKQTAIDARLDIRDYEYADTRADQIELAKEARMRLKTLHNLLVKASEYNVFGAVDIAHLSAQIEQLIATIQ